MFLAFPSCDRKSQDSAFCVTEMPIMSRKKDCRHNMELLIINKPKNQDLNVKCLQQ